MKKLLSVLLLLSLILSSAVAEAPDPIVGTWYAYMEIKGSVFESSFPDADRLFAIVTFDEAGKLFYAEIAYKGDTGEANKPAVMGEWNRNGSEYTVSFLLTGTDRAFIENDRLYLAIFTPGVYFGFNRMIPFDVYSQIRTK